MAWRMLCGLFSYYRPWASQSWLFASSLPSRRPTRTNLRGRKHREKRRQSPPTQAVLFQAQMLAVAQVSRLPCLRRFPPKPTPSLLALPSKAASESSVTTAAKSISINPQKCSNTNRSFLTLSLRIRYFEIVRGGGATHAAFLPPLDIANRGKQKGYAHQ